MNPALPHLTEKADALKQWFYTARVRCRIYLNMAA